MGKRYPSVVEMVSDLASPDFAKQFKEERAKTRLARTLFNLRHLAGLTEGDVAERLGWTAKRVENFERREVDKINFGDFERYLTAIGLNAEISFFEEELPIVDHVKYHVFETRKLMHQLTDIVEEDEKISQEVEKFFGEYFFNIVWFQANIMLKLYRAKITLTKSEKHRVKQFEQFLSLMDEDDHEELDEKELGHNKEVYISSETKMVAAYA